MDETLSLFVREALARGVPKAEIESTLLTARWPRDEVRNALDSFADIDFPIPVPRPKPYLSAREAFVYMVLFTMLYLSAWNFGTLLFQLIHYYVPDPTLNNVWRGYSVSRLRWAVAALLIAFPAFLYLSRKSYLAARKDPEKRKSKVRKWLTHLTLFLAAGTLVGDLITLLFNLLQGELTTRFFLKVLVVGGIAGAVLIYYLWDLRQDDLKPEEIPARHLGLRAFALVLTVAVVASLVAGLLRAGSPGRARQGQLDGLRVSHLADIASTIDRYREENETLPPDLETLERSRLFSVKSISDPGTDAPYEYRITGDRSYELCATFDTRTDPKETRRGIATTYRSADRSFWRHDAGRACFAVEVSE